MFIKIKLLNLFISSLKPLIGLIEMGFEISIKFKPQKYF